MHLQVSVGKYGRILGIYHYNNGKIIANPRSYPAPRRVSYLSIAKHKISVKVERPIAKHQKKKKNQSLYRVDELPSLHTTQRPQNNPQIFAWFLPESRSRPLICAVALALNTQPMCCVSRVAFVQSLCADAQDLSRYPV